MAEQQKWLTKLGDQEVNLSTGLFAEQANGSILASRGGTVILATAVVAPKPKEEATFFPLIVDYEERLYAAGKIKGSRWVKREGRPTDEAILTARAVDRSIRPLFPKNFYNDIQVIVTVLSYDEDSDPVTLSILATSAALIQSGAPFDGPISAVRVGKIDGRLIVNPSRPEMLNSTLDLIVSCTAEKVMMIEADGDEIPEEEMLEAIELAFESCRQSIEIQKSIQVKPLALQEELDDKSALLEAEVAVKEFSQTKIEEAFREFDRDKRKEQLDSLEKEMIANLESSYNQINLKKSFAKLVESVVRQNILNQEIRPDGRKLDEIRPISVEVGILPRTHGSGLFTRGQTQCLTIVTLGAPGEVQMIETMEEEGEKRYMHHYNFPPFSTGEVRPIRGASRREIGHGALAERSLSRMIPDKDKFPYTIRLVSEILSSNGSSSMAATCGSALALMDAGVPIRKPVAGVAIGLMTGSDSDQYKILTDIAGIEDFAGDMDFKVAGTDSGITAIQMDTKTTGLSMKIISDTLTQAKNARLAILAKMTAVISQPRAELSPYAPRITSLKIDPAKIGEIIGPGGKMINKIIEESGGKEYVSIDIEEDGTVMVSSTNPEMSKKAIAMIEAITREVEVGEVFNGEVIQIITDRMNGKEIGAIVKILPNKEGMVHISEIAKERINKVSDKLKIGDQVRVKVLGIDKERGRIQLSIRALL